MLERLGVRFEITRPQVDESRHPDEAPGVYVERVARAKVSAVRACTGTVVVAADTAVVHDGKVLGKPGHPEEARAMLRRLQGDDHEVFTAVAVRLGEDVQSLVDVTQVRMLQMTTEEIVGYVDGGEPMDKAGAYALQGRGGLWVESIIGSPFTVVGLPVHLLPRLFAQVGASLDEFSTRSNLSP